jgi:hypothetical protein
MKKLILLTATALLLTGCEDRYRYPCQDPANKDNPECTRPLCEVDGMCFDTLNGLPPAPAQTPVEEPAAPAADCNCNTENTESTGE